MKRFHWDDAEYAEDFATLLRCYGERVYERQILREIFSVYPAESHAVDWGAGRGDLTSLLVEHFQHVYAVEPHPGMRAVIATRCPLAQVVDGTIMSTVLPTKVEVGLISHVFYHVSDYKWGAYTIHAANQLTENGILIVSLKTVDSGCNQMLEDFGAPCYDLYGGLARVIRLHPEFTFSFLRAPASITTTSFADTLKIARFMLCDRDADAFSRPPTEEEFQAYVRKHFWDERKGRGGWECANMLCCVRRNAVYAKHTWR
ncbi:MAG: methyltransferase domain-containing protein [bacterium]